MREFKDVPKTFPSIVLASRDMLLLLRSRLELAGKGKIPMDEYYAVKKIYQKAKKLTAIKKWQ